MRVSVLKGSFKAPQPNVHLQPLLSFSPRVEFAFNWTPSASLQRVSVLKLATVFPAAVTNFKPTLAFTALSNPRIVIPAILPVDRRLDRGSLLRGTLPAITGGLRTTMSPIKSTVGLLSWMPGNIRIQHPSIVRGTLTAHLEPRESVVQPMYVGVGPARVDARKAIPRRGTLAMPAAETPRYNWISDNG